MARLIPDGGTLRVWAAMLVGAWRHRRTEHGGVTDELAMIGLMLGIAVSVSAIVGFILRDQAWDLLNAFGSGD